MTLKEKCMQSFEKVKSLYTKEEICEDLLPALKIESLGHNKTYENACEHLESIHTLPHMLSDIASFIIGWCHGNEFIDKKLRSGELRLYEVMESLIVLVYLAEDRHE